MRKHWIEIKARGSSGTYEAAVLALIGAGSPGVLEEAGPAPDKTVARSSWEAGSAHEPAAPAPRFVTCTAYLPGEVVESGKRLKTLKDALRGLGWTFIAADYTERRNWSERWKTGLKPVRVSSLVRARRQCVVVKPRWAEYKKRPGDLVVEIDPGMAFGTGGHDTTRMCIKALIELLGGRKKHHDVLDVGTGSGVLAIAASLLGARKTVGIDIDPVAVKVARKNVRINNARVIVSSRQIEGVQGRFSAVVANILGAELIRLAPELVKRLAPGGRLVISGILGDEVPMMTDVFIELGLEKVKKYRSREWATLVFVTQ